MDNSKISTVTKEQQKLFDRSYMKMMNEFAYNEGLIPRDVYEKAIIEIDK